MGEYLQIKGGNQLHGRVQIHGAKNAVLPLLALGIMTQEDVIVKDCPNISDIDTMLAMLGDLGLKTSKAGRDICVSGSVEKVSIKQGLAQNMRSSMFMLGALLSSCKSVDMPLPGGCEIGARPLDIHFDGLKRMGADIKVDENGIHCSANQLHGADIVLKYQSVGATENLLMCATLAKGHTTLINCAREPEIISLACGLRAMGARISGEGSPVIHIDGVDRLGGCKVQPVLDRIVAGTILCAVACCGGKVLIDGGDINTIKPLVYVLNNRDCKISGDENHILINSAGRTHACNVTTSPYPLFPTDLQPQLLSCACFADGKSTICERVFENRFAHALELKKLGFDITIEQGRVAHIVGSNCSAFGTQRVHGGDVSAKDLRGGAGLLIVALNIKDKTNVFNPHFIDRGYEQIEDMFCSLGGHCVRFNK